MLYHESGVASTADPLGGSWYVEHLTDEIATQALQEIAEIDVRGGTVAALAAGYQQEAIGDAAYEVQRAVDDGTRIVVGVNAFADDDEAEQRPEPQLIAPELEAEQIARTRAVRERRDQATATARLDALTSAATGTENLLPRIRACVEAEVTLGEISGALRGVWGEHRP